MVQYITPVEADGMYVLHYTMNPTPDQILRDANLCKYYVTSYNEKTTVQMFAPVDKSRIFVFKAVGGGCRPGQNRNITITITDGFSEHVIVGQTLYYTPGAPGSNLERQYLTIDGKSLGYEGYLFTDSPWSTGGTFDVRVVRLKRIAEAIIEVRYPKPLAPADINVESITIDKTEVLPEESLTATVTFKNYGDIAGEKTFPLYMGTVKLMDISSGTLSGGSTSAKSVPLKFALEGTYSICI